MLFISPKYEDYVFPFVTNKWWHVSVVTVLVHPPPPPPPKKRDVTTETLPNIMVVTILDTSEPSSKMLIPP